MGYYVGDVPAQDLVIEPARNEEPIDLTPFNEIDAQLFDPAGVPVVTPGFLGSISGETIVIEWPGSSPFDVAGIYALRLTATHTTTNVRERIPAVRLVVDVEDGWHTLDTARDDWRDAPGYDAWLYELLWSARQQVCAYAPALATGQRPPLSYLRAQIMQARNLWNAGKVDPASGGMGDDTFVLRPFPLDWMIKQVLRPQNPRPVIA
ncbi:hypothetical protein [Glaciibacter psychrotolerans]|uniref:Uncharacterized protein n=1 Tax=Glaciibacter psychrotolerans TaxID=670054 RepID=A0A7Z0J6V6_9MICO|nr:hypothetical protein [Leifsonia psychrotolerans]NYJ20810.1 hypothetical protein [Leifsonia psychrotolerans]